MLLIPTLLILALDADQPIVVEANRIRNDPTAVVCKVEKQRNSRFTKRTCLTRTERDGVEEESKRTFVELRDQPQFNPQ